MIFVDDLFYWPGEVSDEARKHGRVWCHLWCDPGEEEELHKIARKIGLRREYYQVHKVLNHYDLVPLKRELAILNGATPMKLTNWFKRKEGSR